MSQLTMSMTGGTTFGDVIRVARETAGLTQKEAAGIAGISPQYWNDLEHGNRRATTDLIPRISAAIGIRDTDYMLYLTGRWPADILAMRDDCTIEQVERALAAFRAALTQEEYPC